MTADPALPGIRAAALEPMNATVRLLRPPAPARKQLDPSTLKLVAPAGAPTELWEGPALIRSLGDAADPDPSGQVEWRYRVAVPYDAVLPLPGDVYEVVTATDEPALVGRLFGVHGAPVGSSTVVRRVTCSTLERAPWS